MDRMLHNPYSHHYHNAAVSSTPCCEPIPNGLCVGKQIYIRGKLLPTADSFSFNLIGNGNNILHINPRFSQKCIVRNSNFGGWGQEERNGGIPLRRNDVFEIIILVEEDKYRIAINGQHCFDYQHRTSFEEVTHLEIKGDLEIHNITFSGGYHPNPKHINHPPLPFCTDFHAKLGGMIQIIGDIPHDSGRFDINIQSGNGNPSDNVQLHFNPRFNDPYTSEPVVIRTNRHSGGWGGEERDGPSPFRRGKRFEILILIEESEFKVAVNGHHFTQFQHRSPFEEANHLSISGDVNIHSINFF